MMTGKPVVQASVLLAVAAAAQMGSNIDLHEVEGCWLKG
jgi:hypothetical protein